MPKEIDALYGIIQAMREAKIKYCDRHGIEGVAIIVDITVYQSDTNYETFLRKIKDWEHGTKMVRDE